VATPLLQQNVFHENLNVVVVKKGLHLRLGNGGEASFVRFVGYNFDQSPCIFEAF
jgi:hypothetical protein